MINEPYQRRPAASSWLVPALSVLMGLVAIALFGWVMTFVGVWNAFGDEVVVAEDAWLVSAEDFRFQLPDAPLKAGEPVTLTLANADVLPHSFDIDELDLHVEMDAQQTTTVRFTPPVAGTYTITCNVPGHRESGMVATLVVE